MMPYRIKNTKAGDFYFVVMKKYFIVMKIPFCNDEIEIS